MTNRMIGFFPWARTFDSHRRKATGPCALFFVVLFLWGAAPHSSSAQDRDGDHVVCFVSILPEAFFVSRIGGEYVDVHVMVGPGQSPHTYEPTSRQLSDLSGSQVYFSIGVAFEASLLPRIERNFKGVRIVDASRGIALRRMLDHEEESAGSRATTSSNRAESESHSHDTAGLDPHVWLSPRLGVAIAANMRDALVSMDAAHAEVYTENFNRLRTELTNIDTQIAQILSPYKGREFFVFHPAYGYFADAYGLIQVAIEAQGGAPGPRHLAELIDHAKAQRSTTIFVQPQISATYAETVAKAIGARVVSLDPLALNYTENLLEMAHRLAQAYEESGTRRGGNR